MQRQLFKLTLVAFSLFSYISFAAPVPRLPKKAKTKAAPVAQPPAQTVAPAPNPEAVSAEPMPKSQTVSDETAVLESDNEPIPAIKKEAPFDPKTFSMEPKKVKHPLAPRGLMRIDRDKNYIYQVKESPDNQAVSVRFGIQPALELSNPETGSTFEQLYGGNSKPVIMADYEWLLFRSLGRASLTLGSGLFIATGHGEFNNAQNRDKTPKENLTLLAFPNTAGVTWKAQFSDHPLFVPYASGGGIAYTMIEFRDDNKMPKFGLAPAAYGAGGLALNLRFLDAKSLLDMDREYGINAVYLAVEYRVIAGLSKKFDFSSNFINAGFMMQF